LIFKKFDTRKENFAKVSKNLDKYENNFVELSK